MTMDRKGRSGAALARKVGHELVEYAVISAYLYVCFGAVILYKTAILNAEGISYAPYGLAVVKALILGKFILMGQAARLGDRYQSRRVIHIIAHKSLLFLLLVVVLGDIEEAISGIVHGKTVHAVLADMGGSMLWQTAAASLIILLILIPYIAFREISAALGEHGLRQILLTHRQPEAAAGHAHRPPE
jgi:hypothetical protein